MFSLPCAAGIRIGARIAPKPVVAVKTLEGIQVSDAQYELLVMLL